VELPEAILEITDEHRLPGADPRYGPVVVGPVVLDLARCSRSAGFRCLWRTPGVPQGAT
jgi:hypothetical protein